MKLISLVLLVGFAQVTFARGLGSVGCMGSDGPSPLIDLSHTLPPGTSLVPTEGLVEDFVAWDNRGVVNYRNTQNEIYQIADSGESRFLASTNHSLAQVPDALERYLVTANFPQVLDTAHYTPKWLQYPATQYPLKHLYWHTNQRGKDVLYSFETVWTTAQQQQLRIYSYDSEGGALNSCLLTMPEGERFHLGEGHEFPYVFLYKVREQDGMTKLSYYNVRITETAMQSGVGCSFYELKKYKNWIPGRVKQVYRFPKEEDTGHDMYVVRTDHPTKNFLWDDGPDDCRYYDFGKRDVMVLNQNQPVIATWGADEGLSLVYPRKKVGETPTFLRPLEAYTTQPVGRDNLSLSDDGKTLYVASQAQRKSREEEQTGRLLFRVQLNN